MGTPSRDSESELRKWGETPRESFQDDVNTHFDSTVSYWDRVYGGEDLQGRIYRRRQAAVLMYVDAASPPPRARVLEIGCGAGHLTTQLAERGLRVEAIDASPAMVSLTAARADEKGLAQTVHVAVADVHALPFEDGAFDLAVAVGVLPWLHTPGAAMRELARVLDGGGRLVLTADNKARLTLFTDPREALARTPLRALYHKLRRRPPTGLSHLDYPWRVDRMLREVGMSVTDRRTVGFGPLSFLGRPILDDRRAMWLDNRLQRLADQGTPGLRWTGWQYVVLARRRR